MNLHTNLELTSTTLSRSELEAGLSLIRAFYPEGNVTVREPGKSEISPLGAAKEEIAATIRVDVHYPEHPQGIRAEFSDQRERADSSSQPRRFELKLDAEGIKPILDHPKIGKETERKVLLKHALFHLLTQATGHTPPWGILTGIRPSKILHHLNDLGLKEPLENKVLEDYCLIREDKIRLLQEVVSIQRPYLQEIMDHPKKIALYVGIPFCPTRCSYCSFPAYSLQQGREPLQKYLKGLYEEIRVTGAWMKETKRTAGSLYLGGGTPTILTSAEISDLLQWIREKIPAEKNMEFSVEAGRPDTLSREKLLALREQGVNRLSINPQTMHNKTLRRIGRAHTVEDILQMYKLAREISDGVINMDLILGLPGETAQDVQETMTQIGKLRPDNLTIHALAIKRGSKEHEMGLAQNLDKELETMQEIAFEQARSFGLYPYYLYRQKHIAGNLENIGFAVPGAEGRYNIGIMEERQSVIGIGAGASSKVVNPADYSLVNFQHPSNWQVYLKRWPEIHQKRVEAFLTL